MLLNDLDFITDSMKNKSNIKILTSSIDSGNLSHAYLFSGNNNSLLYDIALKFAASVNCSAKGCGRCAVCLNTLKGIYVNILLIEAEGMEITVDKLRQLQHFMSYSSQNPGRKICIIREAELLNEVSANGLLKILEEPPDKQSMFILLTESFSSILPTITSRCMVFDWDFIDSSGTRPTANKHLLEKLLDKGIKGLLEPNEDYSRALDLSIELTDFLNSQVPDNNESIKEQIKKLKDTGATPSEVKKFEDTLKSAGRRKSKKYYNLGIQLVFDIITAWLEDMVSVIAGADANVINYPENFDFIKRNTNGRQVKNITDILEAIDKNRIYLRYSIYEEIALDSIFLKFKNLVT
ncbi:MAG: hypothetical protein JW997_00125 [Actinobacteria bacterium]|nr:hypothetical protein [Actinomycetota bacterium]